MLVSRLASLATLTTTAATTPTTVTAATEAAAVGPPTDSALPNVASTPAVVAANDNSTSSIPTKTILVLPMLTTPFTPPSECTPVAQWAPATVLITNTARGEGARNTTYPHVFLPVTDARYSACMPPGWDDIDKEHRFRFSNAVCPSGYNYNQLSDLSSDQTDADTIPTTARCCPGGFTYTMFYDKHISSLSGANCVRTTPMTALAQTTSGESSSTPTTTTDTTMATLLYQPWFIVWQKREAEKLSPSPPQVSVLSPVSTWEPGTEIDPSLQRRPSNPGALDRSLGQIIGIVAGCVAAAFVIACAVAGYFYVQSKRKRRQAFENEERELQQQRLQRIGEYRRSSSPTNDEPLPMYAVSGDEDKATVSAVAVPPYEPSYPGMYRSRNSNRPPDEWNMHSNRGNISDTLDGQRLQDNNNNRTSHGGFYKQSSDHTTWI